MKSSPAFLVISINSAHVKLFNAARDRSILERSFRINPALAWLILARFRHGGLQHQSGPDFRKYDRDAGLGYGAVRSLFITILNG